MQFVHLGEGGAHVFHRVRGPSAGPVALPTGRLIRFRNSFIGAYHVLQSKVKPADYSALAGWLAGWRVFNSLCRASRLIRRFYQP